MICRFPAARSGNLETARRGGERRAHAPTSVLGDREQSQHACRPGGSPAVMRWMHPPEIERSRQRSHFDPVVEGHRHGLSRDLALAIWATAQADATDGAGRLDVGQAQQRFHELAARLAAHRGQLQPDVGRVTTGRRGGRTGRLGRRGREPSLADRRAGSDCDCFASAERRGNSSARCCRDPRAHRLPIREPFPRWRTLGTPD